GEPLIGRVLVLDALRQRWTEVPLRARAEPAAQAPAAQPPAAPAAAAPVASPFARPEVPVIDAAERRALLGRDAPVTVLDVREPVEVAAGSIPGAVHVPLARLLTEAGRTAVPREGTIVAYCKAGPRSERAAALLRADGRDAVSLAGGFPAWLATTSRSA